MTLYYSIVLFLMVYGYALASEGSTKGEKCSDFDSCHAGDLFRTCSCDDSCYKYGTCCKDSEKLYLMTPEKKEYECYGGTTETPVYAKKTCSKSYRGHEVHRTLCMDTVDDLADVLGTVLVTSIKSKKTYWNKNCAICNDEATEKLIQWTVQVICPAKHGDMKISKSSIDKNLTYDRGAGQWGLKVDDGFVACTVAFIQPRNMVGRLDYCAPNLISNCPNASDPDVVNYCLMYHGERKQKGADEYYKNVHCALCNGVSEDDLECVGRTYSPISLSNGRDVVQLSFSSGTWLDRPPVAHLRCSIGNMWDPLNKRCRVKPAMAFSSEPEASAKGIIIPLNIFALTSVVVINKYIFH